MGMINYPNQFNYTGRGYLDGKMKIVETLDDLAYIPEKSMFRGYTVVVIDDGLGNGPSEYWLPENSRKWQKKNDFSKFKIIGDKDFQKIQLQYGDNLCGEEINLKEILDNAVIKDVELSFKNEKNENGLFLKVSFYGNTGEKNVRYLSFNSLKTPDISNEPVRQNYDFSINGDKFPVFQQVLEGYYKKKDDEFDSFELENIPNGKILTPLTYSGYYRFSHDKEFYPISDGTFKVTIKDNIINVSSNKKRIYYKITISYSIMDYVEDPYLEGIERGVYLNEFRFSNKDYMELSINSVEQKVPSPDPIIKEKVLSFGTDTKDPWGDNKYIGEFLGTVDINSMASDLSIKTVNGEKPVSLVIKTIAPYLERGNIIDSYITVNLDMINTEWTPEGEAVSGQKNMDGAKKVGDNELIILKESIENACYSESAGDWLVYFLLFGNVKACFSSYRASGRYEYICPDNSTLIPTEIRYNKISNELNDSLIIDNGLYSGNAQFAKEEFALDYFDVAKYFGNGLSNSILVSDLMKYDEILLVGRQEDNPEGIQIRATLHDSGYSETFEIAMPFSSEQFQIIFSPTENKNEFSVNMLSSMVLIFEITRGDVSSISNFNISLCNNIVDEGGPGAIPHGDLLPSAIKCRNISTKGSRATKSADSNLSKIDYVYDINKTILNQPSGDVLSYKFKDGIKKINRRNGVSELHFSSMCKEVGMNLIQENNLANLITIDFPKTLESIEIGSFVGLCNLKELIFRSEVPPKIIGESYVTPTEELPVPLKEGEKDSDFRVNINSPFSWNFINISNIFKNKHIFVNDIKGMFGCCFYVPENSLDEYKNWLLTIIHLDERYRDVLDIKDFDWEIKPISEYSENENSFEKLNNFNDKALLSLNQAGIIKSKKEITYDEIAKNYIISGDCGIAFSAFGQSFLYNIHNIIMPFEAVFNIKYPGNEAPIVNFSKLVKDAESQKIKYEEIDSNASGLYYFINNRWKLGASNDSNSENSIPYFEKPVYSFILPPLLKNNVKIRKYIKDIKNSFILKATDSEYLKKAIKKLYDLNIIKSESGITYNEFDWFGMNYSKNYSIIHTDAGEDKISSENFLELDNLWSLLNEGFGTKFEDYSIEDNRTLMYDPDTDSWSSILLAIHNNEELTSLRIPAHPGDKGTLTERNEILLIGLASKDETRQSYAYDCLKNNIVFDGFKLRAKDNDVLLHAIPSLYSCGLIASPLGITFDEFDKNYMFYSEDPIYPYISSNIKEGFNENAMEDGYGDNDLDQIVIFFDNGNKVWRSMRSNGTTPELYVEGSWLSDDSEYGNPWPKGMKIAPYLSISLAKSSPEHGNPTPSYQTLLQYVSDTFISVSSNVRIKDREDRKIYVDIDINISSGQSINEEFGAWYSEDNGKTKIKVPGKNGLLGVEFSLKEWNKDYLVGGYYGNLYDNGTIININTISYKNIKKEEDPSGFIRLTCDVENLDLITMQSYYNIGIYYINPSYDPNDINSQKMLAGSKFLIKENNSLLNGPNYTGKIDLLIDVPQADIEYQIGIAVCSSSSIVSASKDTVTCLIPSTNPSQTEFVFTEKDDINAKEMLTQLYNAGLIGSMEGITNFERKKNYIEIYPNVDYGPIYSYQAKNEGFNGDGALIFNSEKKTWESAWITGTNPDDKLVACYPELDFSNFSVLNDTGNVELNVIKDSLDKKDHLKIKLLNDTVSDWSLQYNGNVFKQINFIGEHINDIITGASYKDSIGNPKECQIYNDENSNNIILYSNGHGGNATSDLVEIRMTKFNDVKEYDICEADYTVKELYFYPVVMSISLGLMDESGLHGTTDSFKKLLKYVEENK